MNDFRQSDFEEDIDGVSAGAGPNADTQQVLVDFDAIKHLLKESSEVFIEVFLAEHLAFPVPEFHKTIFDRLKDDTLARVLLAIPRDHAKTTLAKLAVLWYFLFSDYRFAVYLSNTSTIAIGACRDIMEYMKSPNFVSLFGEIEIHKESETIGLWIFSIGTKRCILRAAGAGQQMRGINVDNARPDIAVVDDLEDIDNTATEMLQKKLDTWMFRTFLKAMGRRCKVIWLGNMISNTCLLFRLSQRPNWNPVVLGSLVFGEDGTLSPLWPDRWPLEVLAADLEEYQDLGQVEGWFAEMMNMPGAGVNGFATDGLKYADIPDAADIIGAFITIDPAFSEKTSADDCAVVVHVIPRYAPPMVVDYRVGKWDEYGLYLVARELAREWRAWLWGIESVAAQGALGTLFRLYAIQDHLEEVLEIHALPAGITQKAERIGAWVSLIAKGGYALPRGDIGIAAQLSHYDRTKRKNKDDLIDSCAYGLLMLTMYMTMILDKWQGLDPEQLGRPGVAKYGMEIADA